MGVRQFFACILLAGQLFGRQLARADQSVSLSISDADYNLWFEAIDENGYSPNCRVLPMDTSQSLPAGGLCSLKTVANFIGDIFDIAGIEGYSVKGALQVYHTLLEQATQIKLEPHLPSGSIGVMKSISKVLRNAYHFFNVPEETRDVCRRLIYARRARRLIENLAPTQKLIYETDESKVFFFPCGYSNTAGSGHAIYCEIFRPYASLGPARYALAVYNSGEGVNVYHQPKRFGPRLLHQPLILYEQIPAEKLLDDGFLLALFELQTMPSEEAAFSSEHLYINVLNRFQEYLTTKLNVPYFRPQMSGTCTFSGITFYLRLKHFGILGVDASARALETVPAYRTKDHQFKLVFFTLGKCLVSHYLNKCTSDDFASFTTSDKKLAPNRAHLAPKLYLNLIVKFVRYLAWIAQNFEDKHEEYFIEDYNSHWMDAVANVTGTPVPRNAGSYDMRFHVSDLNDLLHRAQSLASPYAGFANNNWSRAATYFPSLSPRIFDIPWLDESRVPSHALRRQKCALLRFPISPEMQLSYNSLVSVASVPTLSACFGDLYEIQASYLSHYILKMPYSQALYVGATPAKFMTVVQELFYHMIQTISFGHNVPFYDYALALYKLYFVYYQLALGSDTTGLLERAPFPYSLLETLKAKMHNLPYASYLDRCLAEFEIQLSHTSSAKDTELGFGIEAESRFFLNHETFQLDSSQFHMMDTVVESFSPDLRSAIATVAVPKLKNENVLFKSEKVNLEHPFFQRIVVCAFNVANYVSHDLLADAKLPPSSFYDLREIYFALMEFMRLPYRDTVLTPKRLKPRFLVHFFDTQAVMYLRDYGSYDSVAAKTHMELDAEEQNRHPLQQYLFSANLRSENSFLVHFQEERAQRYLLEINLFQNISAVNLMHYVHEHPHCAERTYCRLLLNHILLSDAGIKALANTQTGLLSVVNDFLEHSEKKYKLLAEDDTVLYAFSLKLRMNGLLGHEKDNVNFIRAFWGKASRYTAHLFSSVLLLAFDTLSEETLQQNRDLVRMLMEAHVMYRQAKRLSEKDISIEHQCNRALFRFLPLVMEHLQTSAAETCASIAARSSTTSGSFTCIAKGPLDPFLCSCTEQTSKASVFVVLLQGSVTTNADTSSAIGSVCADNPFMAHLYKRNLITDVLSKSELGINDEIRSFKFSLTLQNSEEYFLEWSALHGCSLYKKFERAWYRFFDWHNSQQIFQTPYPADLGLDPHSSFLWCKTNNRGQILISSIAHETDTAVCDINAVHKTLHVRSDMYLGMENKLYRSMSYLRRSLPGKLTEIPEALGQLALFSNGNPIVKLDNYFVFTNYYFRGRPLRLENLGTPGSPDLLVLRDDVTRYKVCDYRDYAALFKDEQQRRGVRKLRDHLVPHLILQKGPDSFFVALPQLGPDDLLNSHTEERVQRNVVLIALSQAGTLSYSDASTTRFHNILSAFLLLSFGLQEEAAESLRAVHHMQPLKDTPDEPEALFLRHIIDIDQRDAVSAYLRVYALFLIHSNNHWYPDFSHAVSYNSDLANLFFNTVHLIPRYLRIKTSIYAEKEFGMLSKLDVLHLFESLQSDLSTSDRLVPKHKMLLFPSSISTAFRTDSFSTGDIWDVYDRMKSKNVPWTALLAARRIAPKASDYEAAFAILYLSMRLRKEESAVAHRKSLFLDMLNDGCKSKHVLEHFVLAWCLVTPSEASTHFLSTGDYFVLRNSYTDLFLSVPSRFLSSKTKQFVDLTLNEHSRFPAPVQREKLDYCIEPKPKPADDMMAISMSTLLKNIHDTYLAQGNLKLNAKASQDLKRKLDRDIDDLGNELLAPNAGGSSLESIAYDYDGRVVTIDILAKLFPTRSKSKYRYYLKALGDADILEVHQKTGKFLMLNALRAQLQRYLLSKQTDFLKFATTTEFPFKAFNFTFPLDEYPELLLFEYYSGLSIQAGQFTNIQQFMSRILMTQSGTPQNLILQKIMASGKTFVLSTVLAYLIPKHDLTPVLISPKALYIQNALDLMRRTRYWYGQSSYMLTCRRSSEQLSLPVLQWTRYHLEESLEHAEYFVSNPETIQCFQNIYIESFAGLIARNETNVDRQPQEQLGHILRYIKSSSVSLLDEADTISNPTKELNFPDRLVEKMDFEYAKFVALVFKHTAGVQNRRTISTKQYREAVLPPLVEKITELIVGQGWSDYFHVESFDRDSLESFFLHNNGTLFERIDNEGPDKFGPLLRLRDLVQDMLPAIWKRVPKVNYGLSKLEKNNGTLFVIPYYAANKPSENSVFSDYWKTVYFTYEYYLTYPISRVHLDIFLRNSRDKMIEELQLSNFAKTPNETELYRKVRSLLQVDLLHLTDESVSRVHQIFESTMSEMLEFISSIAFVSLDIFTSQISNVPMNVATAFKAYYGYSGTLDNPYLFLDPLPSAVDDSEGKNIESAITSTLHKKQAETLVMKVEPQNMRELVSFFEDSSKYDICTYHFLIDVGALFRNFRNHDMAVAILDACPKKNMAIYYSDEENKLFSLSRIDSSSHSYVAKEFSRFTAAQVQADTELAASFTILDHPHTVGSDIAGCKDAKGIVTAADFTSSKELHQGLMRMRGYLVTEANDYRQHLDFMVMQEQYNLLCQRAETAQIDRRDILHRADQVTKARVESEMFIVYSQRIEVAAMQYMREYYTGLMAKGVLCRESFPRNLFYRSSYEPLFLYRQTMADRINARRSAVEGSMVGFAGPDFDRSGFMKAINIAMPDRLKHLLSTSSAPSSLSGLDEENDSDRTQEQQQEQTRIAIVNVEIQKYRGGIVAPRQEETWPLSAYNPFVQSADKIYAYRELMTAEDYKLVIPKNIYASRSFVMTTNHDSPALGNLLDEYQKHSYQVLIFVANKPTDLLGSDDFAAVLVSLKESNDLAASNFAQFSNHQVVLYDPVADASSVSDTRLVRELIEKNSAFKKLMNMVMILSGSFYQITHHQWYNTSQAWFDIRKNTTEELYYQLLLSRGPEALELARKRNFQSENEAKSFESFVFAAAKKERNDLLKNITLDASLNQYQKAVLYADRFTLEDYLRVFTAESYRWLLLTHGFDAYMYFKKSFDMEDIVRIKMSGAPLAMALNSCTQSELATIFRSLQHIRDPMSFVTMILESDLISQKRRLISHLSAEHLRKLTGPHLKLLYQELKNDTIAFADGTFFVSMPKVSISRSGFASGVRLEARELKLAPSRDNRLGTLFLLDLVTYDADRQIVNVDRLTMKDFNGLSEKDLHELLRSDISASLMALNSTDISFFSGKLLTMTGQFIQDMNEQGRSHLYTALQSDDKRASFLSLALRTFHTSKILRDFFVQGFDAATIQQLDGPALKILLLRFGLNEFSLQDSYPFRLQGTLLQKALESIESVDELGALLAKIDLPTLTNMILSMSVPKNITAMALRLLVPGQVTSLSDASLRTLLVRFGLDDIRLQDTLIEPRGYFVFNFKSSNEILTRIISSCSIADIRSMYDALNDRYVALVERILPLRVDAQKKEAFYSLLSIEQFNSLGVLALRTLFKLKGQTPFALANGRYTFNDAAILSSIMTTFSQSLFKEESGYSYESLGDYLTACADKSIVHMLVPLMSEQQFRGLSPLLLKILFLKHGLQSISLQTTSVSFRQERACLQAAASVCTCSEVSALFAGLSDRECIDIVDVVFSLPRDNAIAEVRSAFYRSLSLAQFQALRSALLVSVLYDARFAAISLRDPPNTLMDFLSNPTILEKTLKEAELSHLGPAFAARKAQVLEAIMSASVPLDVKMKYFRLDSHFAFLNDETLKLLFIEEVVNGQTLSHVPLNQTSVARAVHYMTDADRSLVMKSTNHAPLSQVISRICQSALEPNIKTAWIKMLPRVDYIGLPIEVHKSIFLAAASLQIVLNDTTIELKEHRLKDIIDNFTFPDDFSQIWQRLGQKSHQITMLAAIFGCYDDHTQSYSMLLDQFGKWLPLETWRDLGEPTLQRGFFLHGTANDHFYTHMLIDDLMKALDLSRDTTSTLQALSLALQARKIQIGQACQSQDCAHKISLSDRLETVSWSVTARQHVKTWVMPVVAPCSYLLFESLDSDDKLAHAFLAAGLDNPEIYTGITQRTFSRVLAHWAVTEGLTTSLANRLKLISDALSTADLKISASVAKPEDRITAGFLRDFPRRYFAETTPAFKAAHQIVRRLFIDCRLYFSNALQETLSSWLLS